MEEPIDTETPVSDQSPETAPTQNNERPSTPHVSTGEVDIRSQDRNEFVWKISGVAEKRREAEQGKTTCLYSPSISTSR